MKNTLEKHPVERFVGCDNCSFTLFMTSAFNCSVTQTIVDNESQLHKIGEAIPRRGGGADPGIEEKANTRGASPVIEKGASPGIERGVDPGTGRSAASRGKGRGVEVDKT